MDKKPICENKFQFNTRNKVIGLPIDLENLPNKLIIEGNEMLLKKSFHVSLVCVGKIMEKYNITISDFENKVINNFCEFTKENKIEVLQYGKFRFVEEDDLKSIVVMCEVSNLANFFNTLNEEYSLNIEYPPTHITLYTLESKLGIFITDSNDIKNLTRIIQNPLGFSL